MTAPGCGCLDRAVFGHVCGKSGLPPGGWPNDWRAIAALRREPRPTRRASLAQYRAAQNPGRNP